MGFAYSNALCTKIKLIVLTSVLVLGMMGYGATEATVRRKEKTMTVEKESRYLPGDVPIGSNTKKEDDDEATLNTFM